jgi:hypothetical protein
MTPGSRDEVLPFLLALRGSRFGPITTKPDSFDHLAASLETEVLP